MFDETNGARSAETCVADAVAPPADDDAINDAWSHAWAVFERLRSQLPVEARATVQYGLSIEGDEDEERLALSSALLAVNRLDPPAAELYAALLDVLEAMAPTEERRATEGLALLVGADGIVVDERAPGQRKATSE